MTLHELVLVVHSGLRWLVLGALALVAGRALVLWRRRAEHGRAGERLEAVAISLLDSQFLLGLVLYVVLSPLPRVFLADPGAGMQSSAVRFFGFEHALGMLLGTASVHIGRRRARSAASVGLRHRRVFVGTLLGLLLIAASVPWPSPWAGGRVARPLLRGFGANVPAAASATAAPSAAAAAHDAACDPVYRSRCAACHGASGRGDGPSAASLFPRPRDLSAPSVRQRSDEAIKQVIAEGGGALALSPVMPPHPDLSPAELDQLVRCIRGFQRRD